MDPFWAVLPDRLARFNSVRDAAVPSTGTYPGRLGPSLWIMNQLGIESVKERAEIVRELEQLIVGFA